MSSENLVPIQMSASGFVTTTYTSLWGVLIHAHATGAGDLEVYLRDGASGADVMLTASAHATAADGEILDTEFLPRPVRTGPDGLYMEIAEAVNHHCLY